MSKLCCEYHDNMDFSLTSEKDAGYVDECGLAGMGNALVCCSKCPLVNWYEENQPSRTIDKFKEMYEL